MNVSTVALRADRIEQEMYHMSTASRNERDWAFWPHLGLSSNISLSVTRQGYTDSALTVPLVGFLSVH